MRIAIAVTTAAAVAGGVALAQQTTEGAFPLGQNAEPQVGQPYIVDTFADWQKRCIKLAEGTDPCEMYQLVKDDQGFPVAEISIVALGAQAGGAAAGATVVTPLGTLLTVPLGIGIDGGPPKSYPYQWCEQAGCITRVGFSVEELDKLKSGERAALTLRSVELPNQPLILQVSLKGFSKAWASVGGE